MAHTCMAAPGRGGTKVQRQYVHEGRELCTPKLNERGVEKIPSPESGFFMKAAVPRCRADGHVKYIP